MFTQKHHHHIDFLILLKDRLGLLYIHLMLQAFAISLIAIFVPIYLLSIGFRLEKVFFYLLIEWSVFGLFSPLYGKIIHKVGLREVILIRTPIFILALYLLNLLQESILLQTHFYIVPILMGFSSALYTLSITSLFAYYIGDKNQSLKTAKMMTYPKFVSILAPAIGGLVSATLGFSFLLVMVMFLLLISIIPIYKIKKNIDHPKFDINILKEIKIELHEFIFLNSYGIKSFIIFIFLPIAIYLYNQNIISLGLIISFLSLVSAFFTLYVGKLSDKLGTIKLIRIGAIVTALLFLSMGYFFESNILYFLSIFSGFVGILIDLPYETHLYKKSRSSAHSPLEFLVFKEFSLYFGRLILFSLMIILLSNIDIAFYIGSLASFIFLFFG